MVLKIKGSSRAPVAPLFQCPCNENIHIVNPLFSLFLVHDNLLCGNLTVTGDNWSSVTGTYLISEEKASKSPNTPVYKLQGQDRYIYFTLRSGNGWCIGRKEDLSGETEGYSYYYSGLDTIEPWLVETQWSRTTKPEKVQVKCSTSEEKKNCASNPCSIHGQCMEAKTQYFCLCTPNFTGQKCDQEITAVPDVECSKIKVSGSDYQGCNGTYFVIAEKANSSSKPVYKKIGYDRFIYHYPSSTGWRIGVREYLSPGEREGTYIFKGNNQDATEPWQPGNEWDNKIDHQNTVRVECDRG